MLITILIYILIIFGILKILDYAEIFVKTILKMLELYADYKAEQKKYKTIKIKVKRG